MLSKRRREQTEPKSAPSLPPSDDSPESAKRRLNRSSDHEALLAADPPPGWQRIEEVPTEPRHALPTFPDVDWDTPTIPDGKTLDSWDIDERG